MRIVSLAQSTGKIPETFHGDPMPEGAKKFLSNLDAKYNLSPEEIESLLESLEFQYKLISVGPLNGDWSKTEKVVSDIFHYIRETNQNFKGWTLGDLGIKANRFVLEKKVNQKFANRPWTLDFLSKKEPNNNQLFQKGALALDSEVEGGFTDDEFHWLISRGKISASSLDNDGMRENFANIIKWARATQTNLSNVNDLTSANVMSFEWANYQKNVEIAKRLSKKKLRSVPLSGKWKAIWIDPEAHHLKPGITNSTLSEDFESDNELEMEITGIEMDTDSSELISIRDPNGVPQATIEIMDQSATKTIVRSIAGTTAGKAKIKEFSEKMKKLGETYWWDPEESMESSVERMYEVIPGDFGFVPTLRLKNVGTIDDKSSYEATLHEIYRDAWGGSYYYSSRANKHTQLLADYAEERGELHLLEDARQVFEEESWDQWFEYSIQLENDGSIPRLPDSDDEKYNVNGVFNKELFEADEKERQKLLEPYEEDFEPNAFSNEIYKNVQARINKPENKPYYDDIQKKREEANRIKEEKRRREEDEKTINEVISKFEETPVEQSFPEEEDEGILASTKKQQISKKAKSQKWWLVEE
jgi:hypothetical protein